MLILKTYWLIQHETTITSFKILLPLYSWELRIFCSHTMNWDIYEKAEIVSADFLTVYFFSFGRLSPHKIILNPNCIKLFL